MTDITFTAILKKADGTTSECTATISNNTVSFEKPDDEQED